MARTSKSLATGTVLSTIGASRIPGMMIVSPGLRKVPCRLWLASRIASESSIEVRYLVRFRYLRATVGRLSPRWATYRSQPGGATTGTVAGASAFLVALAVTLISCAAWGFCTPAAVGERKPTLVRATRITKLATLVRGTLAIESRAFDNRDKEFLQRGNPF